MAKKRILKPQLPDCEAGCADRKLVNTKILKDDICTEELRVASVMTQYVLCDQCFEEFSYPIGAKEH